MKINLFFLLICCLPGPAAAIISIDQIRSFFCRFFGFWFFGSCDAGEFDFDKNGRLDDGDLILVLRSIADPLGNAPSGEYDLNGDDVVDVEDALVMLGELIDANGAESVLPLSLTYNDDHDWDFVQSDLEGTDRRVLKRDAGEVRFDSWASEIRSLQGGQTCGLSANGNFAKGSGPKPTINWDNGYSRNTTARPN